MSVFTDEQANSNEGPNIVAIRRNDLALRKYAGQDKQVFMTSDEYLHEVAYKKGRIIKSLSLLLKQSAIDCEIHRKLHKKEEPTIQCMRFDSTVKSENLAYFPGHFSDERDSLYKRNLQKKSRNLQRIRINGFLFILDPLTKEVFDFLAFDDTNRLLKIGMLLDTKVQFFTSTIM